MIKHVNPHVPKALSYYFLSMYDLLKSFLFYIYFFTFLYNTFTDLSYIDK